MTGKPKIDHYDEKMEWIDKIIKMIYNYLS
jgi:hypothetical protein